MLFGSKSYTVGKPVYFSACVGWAAELSMRVAPMKNLMVLIKFSYCNKYKYFCSFVSNVRNVDAGTVVNNAWYILFSTRKI